MAEKKDNKNKKDQSIVAEGTEVAVRKLDLKKVIIVLVVMAVVIVIALVADRQINSRPVTGSDDAFNRFLAAGALSNNPSIDYDTTVETTSEEPVRLNGKIYYPIEVIINYDTPEAKTLPMFYVEQKNGDLYVDDGTGKLVPWGV